MDGNIKPVCGGGEKCLATGTRAAAWPGLLEAACSDAQFTVQVTPIFLIQMFGISIAALSIPN